MRIAVTSENGNVFQHFGRTENFDIFDVEDNKIIEKSVLSSGGEGHGALARILSANNVDVLICGGIGGGAKTALADNNIDVVAGASGNTEKAAADFLNGKLVNDESIECSHHSHDSSHTCGDHGCGNH